MADNTREYLRNAEGILLDLKKELESYKKHINTKQLDSVLFEINKLLDLLEQKRIKNPNAYLLTIRDAMKRTKKIRQDVLAGLVEILEKTTPPKNIKELKNRWIELTQLAQKELALAFNEYKHLIEVS